MIVSENESLSIFQRCIKDGVTFLDVFDKSCSAVLVSMLSILQVYGEFSENSILVDCLALYKESTDRA